MVEHFLSGELHVWTYLKRFQNVLVAHSLIHFSRSSVRRCTMGLCRVIVLLYLFLRKSSTVKLREDSPYKPNLSKLLESSFRHRPWRRDVVRHQGESRNLRQGDLGRLQKERRRNYSTLLKAVLQFVKINFCVLFWIWINFLAPNQCKNLRLVEETIQAFGLENLQPENHEIDNFWPTLMKYFATQIHCWKLACFTINLSTQYA